MSYTEAIQDFFRNWRTFSGRTSGLAYRRAFLVALLLFVPALIIDVEFLAKTQKLTLDPDWVSQSGFLENPDAFDVDAIPQSAIIKTTNNTSLYEFTPSFWTYAPAAFLLVPYSALLTRRLHDIGYPGIYAVVAIFIAFFMTPLISHGFVPSISFGAEPDEINFGGVTRFALLVFLSWIVSCLAFVVLVLWSFAPSDPEANEFGPPPEGSAT